MFIAMNRFKIVLNKEADFENIWKNRETHLDNVSGFIEFHLVKGKSQETWYYTSLSGYNVITDVTSKHLVICMRKREKDK